MRQPVATVSDFLAAGSSQVKRPTERKALSVAPPF